MKLRNKALLFLGASFLLFLALLISVAHLILLPRAVESEAGLMENNLRRVEAKIGERLARVDGLVAQWSNWDDTHTFAMRRASSYAAENFTAPSLASLGLNLVAVLDASGRMVDGRIFNPQTQEVLPLPENLRRDIAALPEVRAKTEKDNPRGLLPTDLGILLLSARPVLKTDLSGPVAGTLIGGEWVSPALLREMANHEPFTVAMVARGSPEFPNAIPKPGREVETDGDDRLLGRLPLADLKGRTVALLRLESSRQLYQQQWKSVRLFFVIFVTGAVLLFGCVWLIMDLRLIRRLERLERDVSALETGGALAPVLAQTRGSDEVSRLTRATGRMASNLLASKAAAEDAARVKSEFLAMIDRKSVV